MAQPSVAREPSMEEILASIRRIIESNEPVGAGATPHDFSAYREDEDDARGEGEMDFGPEMAANDAGMPSRHAGAETTGPTPSNPISAQPVAAEQVAAQAEMSERSLSLADVAARVRAASGRAPEAIETTPVETVPAPRAINLVEAISRPAMPPIPELNEPVFARAAAASAPEPVEPPTAAAPLRSEPVMASDVTEPEMPAATVALAETREELAMVSEAGPVSLPAKIEAAANLMSEEAGAQVARSFGELADVFNGIEAQSLEDMAQEMLRPMLQEWLDDNLPTLVERLVREEIERVARGPRR